MERGGNVNKAGTEMTKENVLI